ncbi:MAG: HAD family phosphatase [Parachlamydiales bacterium]|nr:HAD family phosphatase [Parachlamydiales bacterium]
MKWLKKFNLFLFDLDGLLVNTEIIHYQAYVRMLQERGFDINWSFLKYCEVAHLDDIALRDTIYQKFPDLYNQQSNWNILRNEKNKIYMDLLKSAKVDLMEGAEKLLKELEKQNINRCVVTNSSKEMTDIIKKSQPVLKTIPHWITREDYEKSKPDPECYLRAIELFSEKGDRIIGFEDSLRGIQALMKTPAIAVLISPRKDPKADSIITSDVFHFDSLKKLPEEKLF